MVEEQLTPASLLGWCQDKLNETVPDSEDCFEYKAGMADGINGLINDLILYFDLEGK